MHFLLVFDADNTLWDTNSVFTPSPTAPDAMVLAWNSVVPAPGPLALLGAAGVVGFGRRRRPKLA